ncbi:MFS transporter [Pseudomonas sp. S31]|uniref:MFS transporter n=1 Tax=Pseudomonas sp. S31 TaxID=1564473 RepID=UPI00191222D4|nr:MFS transporter [Pseudomonas sp. S31]MBK5000232.1 MFS transporter [Pseudomonas sp. S31]
MSADTRHAIAQPTLAGSEDVLKKVAWRILPFLFISYVLCNIDRSNVAIAHLQFSAEIGLSAAQYGLGASLFFIGYILFEVPSNMMLERFGARVTLTRIMVLWGLVTAGFMLVQSVGAFYLARILLGIAEAGFLPGMILYLSYWFPASRRGRITSWFTLGIPVAGVIGSPLSGFLMTHFDGWHGLSGWKWMFIIEGGITVFVGLLAWFMLDDRPATSKRLSAEEKSLLNKAIEAEHVVKPGAPEGPVKLLATLRSPITLSLGFVYFSIVMSMVVLNYWAPSFIKESIGGSTRDIAWYSAGLYAVGAIGMLVLGWLSDRFMLRRAFVGASLIAGALTYAVIASQAVSGMAAYAVLSLAAFFTYGSMPVFWSIPASVLSKKATAVGIAAISALANFAGMIGPVVIGWSKSVTGYYAAGVYLLAVTMLLGAVVVLVRRGKQPITSA